MMVFLAAVIASGRSAEGMSHPTMTFTEVAETAHLVVVGTAGPGTARREPGAKMIFTDFEFTDLEVLHVGKESTQVDDEATVPPEKITVSIAGGTIGNETILIPHGPSFWEGQRYILFLLDDGRPYVDPRVGGAQGHFRVEIDPVTGEDIVITAGRRVLLGMKEGDLVLGSHWEIPAFSPPIEYDDDPGVPTGKGDPDATWTVTSLPTFEFETAKLETFRGWLADALGGEVTPIARAWTFGDTVLARAVGALDRWIPDFATEAVAVESVRTIGIFGTWDSFPVELKRIPTRSEFADALTRAIDYWNSHGSIFSQTTGDEMTYLNGENEVGFEDEDEFEEFDFGTALGMASLVLSGETLSEVDVALNEDVVWTYDRFGGYPWKPGERNVVQATLMHELGHVTGLTGAGADGETYDYDVPTVLHSSDFDDGEGIHAVDAALHRDHYSDRDAAEVIDVGVEMYRAHGGLVPTKMEPRLALSPGDQTTAYNVTIENISPVTVHDVVLSLYFGTSRTPSEDDVLITERRWDERRPFSWASMDVTFRVPRDLPGDDRYYLIGRISVDGDTNTANDVASSFYTVQIEPEVRVIGAIQDASRRHQVEGVRVATLFGEVETDASGEFEIFVPREYTGPLTFELEGYEFDPPSLHLDRVIGEDPDDTGEAVLNLGNATVAKIVLSGEVVDQDGSPLEGVWIEGAPSLGPDDRVLTDVDGRFAFAVDFDFTGTLAPWLLGYRVSPRDLVGQDRPREFSFTAYAADVNVYARLEDEAGRNLEGVDFIADGGGFTAIETTVGTGVARFAVPYGWSGSILPLSEQYEYTPPFGYLERVTHTETVEFVGVARDFTSVRSDDFVALEEGALSWVDFDADGDLDLFVAGSRPSSPSFLATLLRNDGSVPLRLDQWSFSDAYDKTLSPFLALELPAVDWADFDGDGRVDAALGGLDSTGGRLDVYRNVGTPIDDVWHFRRQEIADSSVMGRAQPHWFDADNDGDQDLLVLTFPTEIGAVTLYRNDGPDPEDADRWTFTEVKDLPFGGAQSIDTGDFDRDGDLDVLVGGDDVDLHHPIQVYENRGALEFRRVRREPFVTAIETEALWFDATDDGALDAMGIGPQGPSIFYWDGRRYDFRFLYGGQASLPAIGDLDHDGGADLVLLGTDNQAPATWVLRNPGTGVFHEIVPDPVTLAPVSRGVVALGDFDGDRDLDVAVSGRGADGFPVLNVTRNTESETNGRPGAPGDPRLTWQGDEIVFRWLPASDDWTGAPSYNVVVSNLDGREVVPGHADEDGHRRLPEVGNAGYVTHLTLRDVGPGSYCWQVQAIDGSYVGSAFTDPRCVTVFEAVETTPQESTFEIGPVEVRVGFRKEAQVDLRSYLGMDATGKAENFPKRFQPVWPHVFGVGRADGKSKDRFIAELSIAVDDIDYEGDPDDLTWMVRLPGKDKWKRLPSKVREDGYLFSDRVRRGGEYAVGARAK